MTLPENSKKPLYYTLIIVFAGTLLRLWVAGSTGLGIGEAYYFRGAENLDLSYFDQPPLFFWLSGLSIRLLGYSTFALRLPAVLLFAGTTWLMFIITRRLFNAWAGLFAVILLNISIVFTIPVAAWFQPDAPLMFFWLLCTWLLIRILFPKTGTNTQDIRNRGKTYLLWILTGIILGLTTLSKYHAGFLLAGTLLFVIVNKNQRHWIWHPGPYIALLICALISTPVIMWNMEHNWASFAFQGARAGSGGSFSLHLDWFFRSILGQALWIAPWIWIPLVFQLFVTFKKRSTNPVFYFCFWTAILPIVFFTVVTLWSDTGFHFHWQAPGYLMLFFPLGLTVYNRINSHHKKRKRTIRWLYGSAAFTIIFGAVLLSHTETGFWQRYGPRWIVQQFGGEYDPTIEGTDYDEIYDRFVKERWMEDTSLFVASVRWWQAGKIDWALKGQKDVIIFHHDPRNYAYFFDPCRHLGKDAILVAQGKKGAINDYAKPFFDEITQLQDIEIKRNNITELTLQVYYCRFFKVPDKPVKDVPVYRKLMNDSL